MFRKLALLGIVLLIPASTTAQGTLADYERAMGLRDKYRNLSVELLKVPTGSTRLTGSGTARPSPAEPSTSCSMPRH